MSTILNVYNVDNYIEPTSVVVDMFTNILNTLGYNFLYGHPVDVLQALVDLDKDPVLSATRYPVICLFQDLPEANNAQVGINFSANLHFIIATSTEASYRAPERYEKSFKPILYPMYEAFKLALFESGYFMLVNEDQIQHTKKDRVYWGRNGLYGVDGNIFADKIDAIELTNVKLQTYSNP
jgi:hypothetical protein